MKLVIASDLHGAARALRSLAARIEAEAPDRVLLLGDLLYHVPRMTPDDPPALAPGSALLTGHTHVKALEDRGGVLFANPGSTSIPKDGAAGYTVYEHGAFALKSLAGETLAEGGW